MTQGNFVLINATTEKIMEHKSIMVSYLVNKIYGYPIIHTYDKNGSFLYAYNRIIKNGVPYFIDLRGITTKENIFFVEKLNLIDMVFLISTLGNSENINKFLHTQYNFPINEIEDMELYLNDNSDIYLIHEQE